MWSDHSEDRDNQDESMAVLGVCVPPPDGLEEKGIDYTTAGSAREAINAMRMLRFELVVVSTDIPDTTPEQLMRKVTVAWPWQKWVLVGANVTEQQEINARSMGAMGVFGSIDAQLLGELTAAARRSVRRRTGRPAAALEPLVHSSVA